MTDPRPYVTPFRRLRRALRAELRAIRRDWRTAGMQGYPYPDHPYR